MKWRSEHTSRELSVHECVEGIEPGVGDVQNAFSGAQGSLLLAKVTQLPCHYCLQVIALGLKLLGSSQRLGGLANQ